MPEDAQEKRKIAMNWRDYLSEGAESVRVFVWVWKTMMGPESRKWGKRMVIYMVLMALAGVSKFYFVSLILDGLVSKEWNLMMIGFATTAILLLIQQFFQHKQMIAREWLAGVNLVSLSREMTRLFMDKSVGQHLQENSTLTISAMEKGHANIRSIMDMLIFSGLAFVFELSFVFLALWLLSPFAGLIATGILIQYVLFMFFLNRKVVEVCVPLDAEFRKAARYRHDRWDQVERVKTNGKEKEETHHIWQWIDTTMSKDRKFWIWFIRICNVRGLVHVIALLLVMAFGAFRVWEGVWTIGLLYPLFSWTQRFSDNLWRIGDIEHQLNWAMPSVKSMMEALTMKSDVKDKPDAIELADEPVSVEFNDLTYEYASMNDKDVKRKPVIQNVNFNVSAGDKVAVIGPIGTGKTTIMRLLMRYSDPKQGSVHVNGHDLRDVKLQSWLEKIAYISQHPQVFDGTVRDNLVYGLAPEHRSRVSDQDLWTLLERMEIDFGDRLTDGLDTKVGRNGIQLSGGQKQCLMIASAALQNPRFMVIDEATASLDSTTEKAVQRGFANVLSGDMSALIIAHRLSTVRDLCNKFVVLKPTGTLESDDQQVEAIAGSFEELYAISPTFKRLADDQGIQIDSIRQVTSPAC